MRSYKRLRQVQIADGDECNEKAFHFRCLFSLFYLSREDAFAEQSIKRSVLVQVG